MDQNVPATELRDALIDFVKREQLAQYDESDAHNLYSPNALVSLGYAIAGLSITQSKQGELVMECRENYSRLRPGDRLKLTTGGQQFSAMLTDTANNGRQLTLRTKQGARKLPSGPWLATAAKADLSAMLINALQRLQPGAPGWSHFRLINGETVSAPVATTDVAPTMYQTLAAEAGVALDESQQAIFEKCALAPQLLEVQGPPGTGKTQVLAFVVEALIRLGKRVIVVAPTHQAVNNALSTLKNLFPNRPMLKVGDDLRRESLLDTIPTRLIPERKQADFPMDTVVGLTFAAALQHLVNQRHLLSPHVLIIDEAGQLPLAQGACAGLVGARSILMFGDDKQMPPIFSADQAEEPLAISIFAWLRQKRPETMEMLQVSHRMNSQLCQAIGRTFYSQNGVSQIVASQESSSRKFPAEYSSSAARPWLQEALSPASSLVWVPVPDTKCMQYNTAEAQLVAELASACLTGGLNVQDLAIVTPFRRQVMLIRNLLDKLLPVGSERPLVDTVERAQGLTVDMVIVSMCASEPSYAAAVARFLFSPNRLNVSVSRARCKAVVLSSPDIFQALPSDYRALEDRNLVHQFLKSAKRVPIA